MTMNEIASALQKELKEEIEGAVQYHTMALAAKEAGHEMESAYIMAMAIDEMGHAAWIYEYLTEEGTDIPEDVKKKYMDLKAAHKF